MRVLDGQALSGAKATVAWSSSDSYSEPLALIHGTLLPAALSTSLPAPGLVSSLYHFKVTHCTPLLRPPPADATREPITSATHAGLRSPLHTPGLTSDLQRCFHMVRRRSWRSFPGTTKPARIISPCQLPKLHSCSEKHAQSNCARLCSPALAIAHTGAYLWLAQEVVHDQAVQLAVPSGHNEARNENFAVPTAKIVQLQ